MLLHSRQILPPIQAVLFYSRFEDNNNNNNMHHPLNYNQLPPIKQNFQLYNHHNNIIMKNNDSSSSSTTEAKTAAKSSSCKKKKTDGESRFKSQRACIHKSNKIFCALCDGRGLCPHRKNRYICKECGGSAICQHKKRRYLCTECRIIQNTSGKKLKSSYAKVIRQTKMP